MTIEDVFKNLKWKYLIDLRRTIGFEIRLLINVNLPATDEIDPLATTEHAAIAIDRHKTVPLPVLDATGRQPQ